MDPQLGSTHSLAMHGRAAVKGHLCALTTTIRTIAATTTTTTTTSTAHSTLTLFCGLL